MISDVDCMRLAMPSGSEEPQRDSAFKRKAWLAVFLGSTLFWVVVALLVWKYWGWLWRLKCVSNRWKNCVNLVTVILPRVKSLQQASQTPGSFPLSSKRLLIRSQKTNRRKNNWSLVLRVLSGNEPCTFVLFNKYTSVINNRVIPDRANKYKVWCQMMNTLQNVKYWSWMGAFTVSTLFWCQLIWLALN